MAVIINRLNAGVMTVGAGGSPTPAGHADTWYKYEGDTDWRTVSIQGRLQGTYPAVSEPAPTTQIPNVQDVVAVEIGTDVTAFGHYSFWGCTKLATIVIPEGINFIEECGLAECSSLTDIVLPNSIVGIGAFAFNYCTNLETVTLGTGFGTSYEYQPCILEDSFNECSKLNSVTFIGKTLGEVQALLGYPFALNESIIHVA